MEPREYEAAVQYMTTGHLPDDFFPGQSNENKRNNFKKRIKSMFSISDDGVLYRKTKKRKKTIYLPIFKGTEKEAKEFLSELHSKCRHLGSKKLNQRATEQYFIPGINQLSKEVVGECSGCQRKNSVRHTGPIQDTSHDITAPGQRIQMDLVGEFPPGYLSQQVYFKYGGCLFS